MPKDKSANRPGEEPEPDPEAELSDDELARVSGGAKLPGRVKYGDITLKRGYIGTTLEGTTFDGTLKSDDE